MSSLRKEARERECQVRYPGVCNRNAQTVVLAHFRLIGISGLGIKPPDWCGAWACSACHALVDSSKDEDVQLAFAHGVLRTLAVLFQERKLR